MHIDYSQLAYAIGEIALTQESIPTPGRTRLNWNSKINDRNTWWNTVLAQDQLLIEQNTLNANYYRAIKQHPDGTRRRVARGYGLQSVLTAATTSP